MMKKKVTFNEYLLFIEAWYSLAIARGMLVFLPFRKILPFMKDTKQEKEPSQCDELFFKRISLAIGRACVRSPWRTKCFEQALAAKMMLKRRGLVTSIYFGVCKDPEGNKKFLAHAWLDCQEVRITGGKNISQYTVLASFKN
jgi:hypothetical protein